VVKQPREFIQNHLESLIIIKNPLLVAGVANIEPICREFEKFIVPERASLDATFAFHSCLNGQVFRQNHLCLL